jgi:hypothetical protein
MEEREKNAGSMIEQLMASPEVKEVMEKAMERLLRERQRE